MRLAPLICLALAVLSCWSCQNEESGSPAAGASGDAGNAGSAAGAAGQAAALHGTVSVTLVAPDSDSEGHTSLLARFFDGPTPPVLPLELRRELGACRLLVPTNPFCSTPCTPAACTADDVCTPYPAPVALGTLSVTGLGAMLNLEPTTSLSIYQSPSLPYPACEAGRSVTASAHDLELVAPCIEPLELSGPDPIPVSSGASVSLAWTPPAKDVGSVVRIGLDLAHHGGKKGEIECEVPDTGQFEIPEPLVSELVSLGLAGYPTINVTRLSRATAAANTELVLVISSSVERAIDSGVRSCLDDSGCSEPEVCRADKTCGSG